MKKIVPIVMIVIVVPVVPDVPVVSIVARPRTHLVKRLEKLLNVGCQHDAFGPLFSTPQRRLRFHSFRLRGSLVVQDRRS
jgi:hypothetical protein